MKIKSLDHVALWVADRDRLADFLTGHVGMHVIDRSDDFTIVGADARRGKLTLFAAEGVREPGPLARIAFRVPDLERALGKLPRELPVSRPNPALAAFRAPDGLELGLVESHGAAYDIDHVTLRLADPERAAAQFAQLGFEQDGERLRVGEAFLELEPGPLAETDRPLLNHLGLLVDSAEEHLDEARRRDLEIADFVDAPNTIALFLWGPERVKLEYVEHKPSFSLV
jgi:catechol 2,3-dioxygenase-like lactoylglutathione lyase family enzyme